MSRWSPTVHGTTFGGNPISCAAAIATIDTIKEEGILENAKRSGKYLLARLEELKSRYQVIGDVRGVGLMTAMELVVPETKREPNTDAARKILNEALSRGLLMYPCGLRGQVIRLAPPLTVTRDQIDEAVGILDKSLASL
jgi:4-aminobutyrate aminotransferase